MHWMSAPGERSLCLEASHSPAAPSSSGIQGVSRKSRVLASAEQYFPVWVNLGGPWPALSSAGLLFPVQGSVLLGEASGWR